MKIKLLISFIVLTLSITVLNGQSIGLNYNFNTGDKELDLSLDNLNIQAKANMSNFLQELSISYNQPKTKLSLLLTQKKLEPADLYMTLLLAKLAKKPVEKVADEYEESRGEGWGVIAKSMGIKPGSPEFHEMKHRVKGHEKKKKKKGRRDKNDDDDDDNDDDDRKSRGRGRGNRGR